jgi:hypothetical protein
LTSSQVLRWQSLHGGEVRGFPRAEVGEPPFVRIWTLHPKYLDAAGLTALWREGLLARQVLLNRTRGYRHHPQLERFRSLDRPVAAINTYLDAVHQEATTRSYQFNGAKIGPTRLEESVFATAGQLSFEWNHLKAKLQCRNPRWLLSVAQTLQPEAHPLFRVVEGPVEDWERSRRGAA